MEEKVLKKGLNSNQLKVIAIIAMTIDHANKMLLRSMQLGAIDHILKIVGRITILIMCFFISEGYFHTKDRKKYIGRLFVFAIISHFAYAYAFEKPIIPKSIFFETSVMWTLLWGLIALCIVKSEKINVIAKFILTFLIMILVINSDWGPFPIVIILIAGMTRGNLKEQIIGMVLISIAYMIADFNYNHDFYNVLYYLGLFIAMIFLANYNGERGNCKWLKWFFYIYYPLHLVILGIIRDLIIL